MKKPKSYSLAALALIPGLSAGCTTQKQIQDRTRAILNEPRQIADIGSLVKQGELPVYQAGTQIRYVGDSTIIGFPIKHIDISYATDIIKDQLGNDYKITSSPKTNQLMVQFPTPQSENPDLLETRINEKRDELQGLVDLIDTEPAQFRIHAHIMRIFGSYTDEFNAQLNYALERSVRREDTVQGLDVTDLNGLAPSKGVIYTLEGIFTRGVSTHFLNLMLSNLKRNGYAEDLASPVLTVENGEEASITNTLRIPIPEQAIVGGVIQVTTKYTDIQNSLVITPYARANGIINLAVTAGVGEVTPSGTDIPNINKRELNIGSVNLQRGQTLVLGGFLDRRDLGTVTSTVLGNLFSGTERENQVNEIVYFLTPEIIDVSQQKDNNPDSKKLEKQLENTITKPE